MHLHIGKDDHYEELEEWLFKNKEAVKKVQTGLKDAKAGRVVKTSEDYSKYIKE